MLKIQEFILAHDNWRELLTSDPYNLIIREEENYVLLKYNQISSDFNEEICREARGIILDSSDNFKVVRMAFCKFFNLGESFADEMGWDTCVAMEKIDGSLMSAWFANGEWHLSTNGTLNAFKAELPYGITHKTFGELFESILPLSFFYNKGLENYCFTFELCSLENKVVLSYPEPQLYLLTVRKMNTLEEIDYVEISGWAARLGVKYPHFYYMNDKEGFCRLVENMPEGHEGIVVRDEYNHRVKIKTLLYFQLHRQANNGKMTLERVVDLIRANDHAEFLAYFPQQKERFDKIEKQLRRIEGTIDKIKQDVRLWKLQYPDAPKKWFAQDFSNKELKHLYFAEYDNKLSIAINELPSKKLITMFKIKDVL